MIVIRCIELTGRARHPARGMPTGLFLKVYDPEAHDGQGYAEWTDRLSEALKFETSGQAWMLWRTVPKARPIRADGQPNRPLAAFTIEIVNEEDV